MAVVPTESSESLIVAAMKLFAAIDSLDQNIFRCSVTKGNSVPIYRAKNGASTRNLGDTGRFAETHFADALAELSVTR